MVASCPHTPQQPARAERKILTLDDKVNAQLQGQQLHDRYWEQCLHYTVHVENVIISVNRPTIPPMQYMTGKVVDVSHLTMPFGTVVYCHNKQRTKRESRKANPGIYVGVPIRQNGILAHIPSAGHIEVTRDYTMDLSIDTKAQRSKIDWYNNVPYNGILHDDDDDSSESLNATTTTPMSPVPTTRSKVSGGGPSSFSLGGGIQSSLEREAAIMQGDYDASVCLPPSTPPSVPPSSSGAPAVDPVLVNNGLTWPQSVGGYGECEPS